MTAPAPGPAPARKDLVVLVADKNMEFALRGLFSRTPSFGIRPVTADIFVHPEKDPGCLLRGHEFLGPLQGTYRFGLVLFDREGCGQESETRADLEAAVEGRLAQSGWMERAKAIVIDPELENWMWADSPHVERILGWAGRVPDLRSWLAERGFATGSRTKPSRPKEAVEEALYEVRKPRSAARYLQLAQVVTLDGCTDAAFMKLRDVLSAWFSQLPESAA